MGAAGRHAGLGYACGCSPVTDWNVTSRRPWGPGSPPGFWISMHPGPSQLTFLVLTLVSLETWWSRGNPLLVSSNSKVSPAVTVAILPDSPQSRAGSPCRHGHSRESVCVSVHARSVPARPAAYWTQRRKCNYFCKNITETVDCCPWGKHKLPTSRKYKYDVNDQLGFAI